MLRHETRLAKSLLLCCSVYGTRIKRSSLPHKELEAWLAGNPTMARGLCTFLLQLYMESLKAEDSSMHMQTYSKYMYSECGSLTEHSVLCLLS